MIVEYTFSMKSARGARIVVNIVEGQLEGWEYSKPARGVRLEVERMRCCDQCF